MSDSQSDPTKPLSAMADNVREPTGMDRKLNLKWYQRKRNRWLGVMVLLAVILIWAVLSTGSASRLVVDRDNITISTVERAVFSDYIAVTGTVEPIRTVYLDVMEGGKVDTVLKEAGSFVNSGDTLVILSNSTLLLDLTSREAQLFEQRSNLQNTRLAMEQHALLLETEVLDLEYQLYTAQRSYEQNRVLSARNLISRQELEDSEKHLRYLSQRHALTLRKQQQASVQHETQIQILERSVSRIESNLALVQRTLDQLVVRAPVSGQLTSLDAEIGQSIPRGARIGRIDILDSFKISAKLDQFYLSRIHVGLIGEFDLDDSPFDVEVIKIYPEVTQGSFTIDLGFTGDHIPDIRRGQTLRIRLELGRTSESTVLEKGAFYMSTSGQWVYVISDDSKFAKRRSIRLGRQSPQVFEVLEGLSPGEKVVTSSYESFGNAEKLVLRH